MICIASHVINTTNGLLVKIFEYLLERGNAVAKVTIAIIVEKKSVRRMLI
jgi:hypothetical protein